MSRYRKKPVVIEAIQIHTVASAEGTPGVCCGGQACPGHGPERSHPHVHTLEGDHTWTPGDWLITGVKGERYFCKPDIFAATYEPEGESPAPCPECARLREALRGVQSLVAALRGKRGRNPEIDDLEKVLRAHLGEEVAPHRCHGYSLGAASFSIGPSHDEPVTLPRCADCGHVVRQRGDGTWGCEECAAGKEGA